MISEARHPSLPILLLKHPTFLSCVLHRVMDALLLVRVSLKFDGILAMILRLSTY